MILKKFNLGIVVEMFVVGFPDEFEIVYVITSRKRVNFYDASRGETEYFIHEHQVQNGVNTIIVIFL